MGKKFRGGSAPTPPPADFGVAADSDDESEDDETDEEEAELEAEQSAEFVNMMLGAFQQQLVADGTSGPEDAALVADRALIEKGMHEAFRQTPPEDLQQVFGALAAFSKEDRAPPSLAEIQQFQALAQQIQSRMPADAAAAMERRNKALIPMAEGPKEEP